MLPGVQYWQSCTKCTVLKHTELATFTEWIGYAVHEHITSLWCNIRKVTHRRPKSCIHHFSLILLSPLQVSLRPPWVYSWGPLEGGGCGCTAPPALWSSWREDAVCGESQTDSSSVLSSSACPGTWLHYEPQTGQSASLCHCRKIKYKKIGLYT